MNNILSIFALVLCFFAFLNLNSVKGFNFNELIHLVEKIENMSKQNAKNFDDAVNNRTEFYSFFVENKASHCDTLKFAIDQEFIKCSNDTKNYWEKVENIEKQNCCSYYDLFNCKISSAKRLCDSSAFGKYHKREVENVENQEKNCPNYSRQSYKCRQNVRNLNHFPVWLIILIIFLGIEFIGSFIVSFVIKMRKLFLLKTPAQH
jgi:hypothetical protein